MCNVLEIIGELSGKNVPAAVSASVHCCNLPSAEFLKIAAKPPESDGDQTQIVA